jgi:hypothetical protein
MDLKKSLQADCEVHGELHGRHFFDGVSTIRPGGIVQ